MFTLILRTVKLIHGSVCKCRGVMWKMENGIAVCQESASPYRIHIVLDY